tara:strand:- start:2156 stop:2431 length:276 start_codon:yes stop_codon:yes gene_type:complete
MNNRPKNISLEAQYLSGIGASAWFEITKEKNKYRIKRFSEEGKLECDRLFTTSKEFNIKKPFKFTYLSHCKECSLLQEDKIYVFKTNEYEY